MEHENSSQHSSKRSRDKNWSDNETSTLIEIWAEKESELKSMSKKGAILEAI